MESKKNSTHLSQTELSYFKLLKSLRKQSDTSSQYGIIATIARWIDSSIILRYICKTPDWYGNWQVREALLQNGATPSTYKNELKKVSAVFDLMREMDISGIPTKEKNEISEDIRAVFSTLSKEDRNFIKLKAYSLSSGSSKEPSLGTSIEIKLAEQSLYDSELEEIATEVEDIEEEEMLESVEAAQASFNLDEHCLITKAETSSNSYELAPLLFDSNREVRLKALTNPALDLGDLEIAVPACREIDVLELVSSEASFFKEEGIRKALLSNSYLSPGRRIYIQNVDKIINLLTQMEDDGPSREERRKGLIATFKELDMMHATDHDSLFSIIKNEWPHLANLVKLHLDRAFSEPSEEEDTTTVDLRDLSFEKKLEIALSTNSKEELAILLYDQSNEIVSTVLANKNLNATEAFSFFRKAQRDKIELLHRSSKWMGFRETHKSLVHNPNASRAIALNAMASMSNTEDLLGVLKDPKISGIEIKSKAKSKLEGIYKAMGTSEKIAAIRKSGGSILRELWMTAFRDEQVLSKLLDDRAIDEGIVIRIARSSIAPRRILEKIGRSPSWSNRYSVILELARNPKTPHSLVSRLLFKLNAIDRKNIVSRRGLKNISPSIH